MRRFLRNRYVAVLALASIAALTVVSVASAAPGDPPTFDANDLSGPINDYATTLLAGSVIVLGVVLLAIAPFVVFKLGVKYIGHWFGRAKASTPA